MISSASASPQWLPAARPDGKLWKGFIAQKLRDVIGALRGRIAKHQRHDGRGLVTHTAGWSTPDDPARNIERAHGVKLVISDSYRPPSAKVLKATATLHRSAPPDRMAPNTYSGVAFRLFIP